MSVLVSNETHEHIEYIKAGDLLDMLPEDEGLYIPESVGHVVPVNQLDGPDFHKAKAWGGTDYINDYLEDAAIRPLRNALITGLTASGIDQEPEPEPIKQLADPLRDPKLSWMRSRG